MLFRSSSLSPAFGLHGQNGGSGRSRTSIVYHKGPDLQSGGTHAIVPTLPKGVTNTPKVLSRSYDNIAFPSAKKVNPTFMINDNWKLFTDF
mgnify:CR=1 FL=1